MLEVSLLRRMAQFVKRLLQFCVCTYFGVQAHLVHRTTRYFPEVFVREVELRLEVIASLLDVRLFFVALQEMLLLFVALHQQGLDPALGSLLDLRVMAVNSDCLF